MVPVSPSPQRKHCDLVSFFFRPTVSALPLLTPNDLHRGRSRCILLVFFFISSEQQTPQRWDVELHTERPSDDLGHPVPIYTASRWCLSVVRQERVSSNCVKPHIVKADKDRLLSSWHEVQVKHTDECERVSKQSQLAPVLSTTHTHMRHVNECSTSSDPSPVLSLFLTWLSGGANIPLQINLPTGVNCGPCFFLSGESRLDGLLKYPRPFNCCWKQNIVSNMPSSQQKDCTFLQNNLL